MSTNKPIKKSFKGAKNGKKSSQEKKADTSREEAEQEVAVAEIRTTQAEYSESYNPTVYPYRAGCPECHEKSLVTEQKIRTYRVCRCRECGWRGEMEG